MDRTRSDEVLKDPHEKRNLIVFALNQILMRLGWMFKSESVVIPAFIDVYTSSGTIRGLLPLILRIGQSLPQFLVAQRVARMPTKAGVLCFHRFRFRDSVVCVVRYIKPNTLVRECHCRCFSCTVYPALARGGLQSSGKRNATRENSSVLKNGAGYSPIPISSVVRLRSESLFTSYRVGFLGVHRVMLLLFSATALFFGIAAAVSFGFRELPSQPEGTAPFFRFLGDALLSLRYDRNFRRFAVVILLFYSIWPLFPHYTVFGTRTLGLVPSGFVTLIIAQNASNAIGAGIMGNIADRSGNRFVLRILIFISACMPLLAVGISRMPTGAQFYWIIFALMGFTPVSARIVTNYTLEIAPQEKHPQYLGVMSLFQAIPLFVSPLIGALIEGFAFEPVFIGCGVLVLVGFLLTFRLAEPRFSQSA